MDRDEHRLQMQRGSRPPTQERAVSDVVDTAAAYRRCDAFARRVDDIGDGQLEPEQKLDQLEQQARALDQLAPGARDRAGAGTPLQGGSADASGSAPVASAD